MVLSSGVAADRYVSTNADAMSSMQLLGIATVFLFVSSLATVAVPKLAGELIDVCIKFHDGGSEGKEEAKKHLNRGLLHRLHMTPASGPQALIGSLQSLGLC